jgi:hypothetical protein
MGYVDLVLQRVDTKEGNGPHYYGKGNGGSG